MAGSTSSSRKRNRSSSASTTSMSPSTRKLQQKKITGVSKDQFEDGSDVGFIRQDDEVSVLQLLGSTSTPEQSNGTKTAATQNTDADVSVMNTCSSTTNTRSRGRRQSSNRSTSSAAKNKKLSRQEQEVMKTVALQLKVDFLINLATYEVKVDAYRGIFDPDTYQDHETSRGNESKSAGCSDSNVESCDILQNKNNIKLFNSCFGQLDKLINTTHESETIHLNEEDTFNEDESRNAHKKCCENITNCPCLQKWIEKAIKDTTKNKLKSKSKVKATGNGDKCVKSKKETISLNEDPNAKKDSCGKENVICIDTEKTDDENKIESNTIKDMGGSRKTPLFIEGSKGVSKSCNKNKDKMEIVERTAAEDAIEKCTTLTAKIQSTSALEVEVSNPTTISCAIKRSHDTCQCDYNPLCLVSLGGVVDEYMTCKLCPKSPSSIQLQNELRDLNHEWKCMEQEVIWDCNNKKKERSTKVINNDFEDREAINGEQHSYRRLKPSIPTGNIGRSHQYDTLSQQHYGLYTHERFRRLCDKYEQVGTFDVANDNILRQFFRLDREAVELYLREQIAERGKQKECKNLLSMLEQNHKSLSFKSPIISKIDSSSDEQHVLDFCKPVGLQNLGATCYLNSQLQCLSRNLIFLDGLFGWSDIGVGSSSLGDTKMSEVISKLQTLLATMVYGPRNVVTTNEFSSSLGLVNDEMQDPNEFARLLFDRMHESFQNVDNTIKERQEISIGNLLPRIFKGVFQFKTKCLSCNKISSRSEDFMDLLLPIAKNSNLNGKQVNCKAVTIQDCLDEYLKPEMMEGDNQYFCDNCKRKCNAERSISCTRKPLVLNVQLARYTYNFSSGSRQKLMDAVLLPKVLKLPYQKSDVEDESTPYTLCAVQNHVGKSALSGHYVAEAMDWATGTWFEYDDENVKILKNGPTSSYNLSEDLKGATGSSDAYNLFYVQKECLRKSVKKSLTSSVQPIIENIHELRVKEYDLQYKILLKKQQVAYRLKMRRLAIMKLMLNEQTTTPSRDDSYWVDGNTYKRFISCTDAMDDILCDGEKPILQHKHLLCEHGHLHPRTARSGKILSRENFITYASLLHTERRLVIPEKCTECTDIQDKWSDHIVTGSNIECKKCAESYQKELREKLEKFQLIVNLYHNLDPSSSEVDINSNEEHFAVARSFVTNFRKFALKLMKDATSEDRLVVGLDAFELDELTPWTSPANELQKHSIDPTVNGKILCKHGHSNLLNKKNSVKFVTKATFEMIKVLFPKAVSLPIKFKNGQIEMCQHCQKENEDMSNLPFEMMTIVRDGAAIFSSPSSSNDNSNRNESLYLVHPDEIKKIEKLVNLINKKCPPKKGREVSLGKELHSKIMKDYFCNGKSKWRSQYYICKHGMTLIPTDVMSEILLIGSSEDSKTKSKIYLSERDYKSYKTFVNKLETLFFPSSMSRTSNTTSHPNLLLSGGSFVWNPVLCSNKECLGCETDNSKKDSPIDNKTKEPELVQTKDQAIEAIPSDEPVTAKPDETKFFYKVYEFSSSHSLDSIQCVLEKKHKEANEGNTTSNQSSNGPRRSKRQKKSSMDTFELYGGKLDNLAQFRLRVNELCQSESLIHQQLCVFQFDASIGDKSIIFPLSHERNGDSMIDVLDIVKDAPCIEIILYEELPKKRTNRNSVKDKAEKEATTQYDIFGTMKNEDLFDTLIQMASSQLDGDDSENNGQRTKKRRAVERGFQGTFLQSSILQSASNAQDGDIQSNANETIVMIDSDLQSDANIHDMQGSSLVDNAVVIID